ncbi:hypothetical protein NA78x_006249 [Anatilimnocola sp. NA78]|uniref:hypothetical protein n=1 Tax=Anatilimnocola sp. NA78 TaxID=3415683 RepID=UPI003CE53241
MNRSITSLGLLLLLAPVSQATAQEVRSRPYDGIQAGVDAYQLAEERRQANLQAQIGANDAARAASGLPTTRGETIYYYGTPGTAGYRTYGSGIVPLDAAYAYGFGYGGAAISYGRFGRRAVIFNAGPLFTPWPYIPGDIYGYQTQPMVRQPIGQRQVQTGENTWESHPVYDPPVPNRPVLPPVDSPMLDNTPFATPRAAAELPLEAAPRPRERAVPEPADPLLPAPRSNSARDF